jgi:hypothetical protein
VHIIRPDLVFRFIAVDDNVGSAAITPVKDHHAVTVSGHATGNEFNAADITPASRRKRDPGAGVTEDFVVDIDAAYFS